MYAKSMRKATAIWASSLSTAWVVVMATIAAIADIGNEKVIILLMGFGLAATIILQVIILVRWLRWAKTQEAELIRQIENVATHEKAAAACVLSQIANALDKAAFQAERYEKWGRFLWDQASLIDAAYSQLVTERNGLPNSYQHALNRLKTAMRDEVGFATPYWPDDYSPGWQVLVEKYWQMTRQQPYKPEYGRAAWELFCGIWHHTI